MSRYITGGTAVREHLETARTRSRAATVEATKEAVSLVVKEARAILKKEIYDKSGRGEFAEKPDPDDPDSLYQSFVEQIVSLGTLGTVAEGAVLNTSGHAGFLEFGTDDEGTGTHYVGAKEGGLLVWRNPFTGAMAGSKGHEVKGIVPIRFLQRALDDSRPKIVAIFKKHLRRAVR